MAKTAFGEIALMGKRRAYTLRPSFAALNEIEQKTGSSIAALIEASGRDALSASAICIIVSEGLRAAGEPMPRRMRMECLRLAAHSFLLHGLGFLDTAAPASIAAGSSEAPKKPARCEPLNWHELYQTATVTLKLPSQEFWRMTMTELMLQCEALAQSQGLDPATAGAPATQGELEQLMRRFPDGDAPTAQEG